MMVEIERRIVRLPVGTRFNVKVFAAFVVADLAAGLLVGPAACIVLLGAYIGMAIGQGIGFDHGLDASRRIHLSFKLEELCRLEEHMAAGDLDLAVDHPARTQLAAAKAAIAEEIASIR